MKKSLFKLAAIVAIAFAGPGIAQIQTIDPNQADSYQPGQSGPDQGEDYQPDPWGQPETPEADAGWATPEVQAGDAPAITAAPSAAAVPREDVFDAAEDLFGRGAEGLAGMIEDILRRQGEPVAYIVGREAGGSFVFGVRYGSGVMRHHIEGDRNVYWTGPSLGFDFGANADKVFVLVYNLHDTEELFKRYPGAEGNLHVVGGFTAQYLRRKDVVLIPVRMGVGLRLGVNAGYMRFSENNRWLPF